MGAQHAEVSQGRRGSVVCDVARYEEARDFAATVGDTLVLIEGKRLATLMIEVGVGVAYARQIRLAEIDSDYFEEK
jgi:restriction system protein